MRPPSIVIFERLFLASLVLSVIGFIVSYGAMTEDVEREPALQQLGVGGGFVIGTFMVSVAIYLLLWFFIARKASNIAKWILVVLTGIGVVLSLISFARGRAIDLRAMLDIAYYALAVGAVAFLFRSDAVAWLKGERGAGPATSN